jgi:hypothetical protein
VPSTALDGWRGARSDRLDELVAAHGRVGGTAAGRRTDTEQINWALILRLSAEFQGFVRDLHTLGAEQFSQWTAPADPRLASLIANLLTEGLTLDRGNAAPGAIGEAFNRFGLYWWPALRRRDRRTADRHAQLLRLNRARNAFRIRYAPPLPLEPKLLHAPATEIATSPSSRGVLAKTQRRRREGGVGVSPWVGPAFYS